MQPTFPSQFLVNQAKCKQSSLKMLFFPQRWAQLVSILLQGQEAWWRHHSSVTLWGLGNKWRFCRLLRGWMHKPVVCWRLHESQSVSYVQGIIKQYQVILKTLSTFDQKHFSLSFFYRTDDDNLFSNQNVYLIIIFLDSQDPCIWLSSDLMTRQLLDTLIP